MTVASAYSSVIASATNKRLSGWSSRWLTDELKALSQQGKWDAALKALSGIENTNIVNINVFHYTTVITGCGKAGKWEAAMKTFTSMCKVPVEPNVYTYTSIIKTCGVADKPDLAMRAYALMQQKGVPPNVHTMTALISSCAKAGQWEKTIKLVRSCEAMLIAPTVVTYTSCVDACRRAGNWEAAVQIISSPALRNPDVCRPNDVTYNCALNACGVAHSSYGAMSVYAAMRSDGYLPVSFTRMCLQMSFAGTESEGLEDHMELKSKHFTPPQNQDMSLI